jgi:hypothetical protein
MTSNLREWKRRRAEFRKGHDVSLPVRLWEHLVEFLASILVETIQAAGRVMSAVAGVARELSERYRLWSRLALAVALWIAAFATWRVFGPNPPVVAEGTATAFAAVAGLVATVAGLYLYGRNQRPPTDPP